ncbi:DUF536 domain-containing protein (plasmid) [Staphylococcus pasteuri]|uniref:DUF536 domain-containing protein n=2 Tax=Staphylococcus warneri TaxID=1292 RepID=A0A8B2ZK32_STAWA|nr:MULTISPECIES: DUF536 domain-containing protein [Staphylococcus]MBL3399603.1 DUF536 domain-containing protein [Staphylococcus pasteuri]HBO6125382.1 DUF536 domain-containing protein [Pseudomonas aeruginosa]MBL3399606.1 DUF536 domain-containing protein [Staphylococcus pasteuri]MCI2772765.1 DUF536 domain-containing protein [Staphylococcus warneri]MCI2785322.1 DUF536 domain-containing protein [Staphylococcus warneri]
MTENMMTINKLAEKLGVSRPTIYNNVPENMSFTKIDGVNYIDDELEEIITKKISERKQKSSPKNDDKTTTNNQEFIQSLNEEIKYLRQQLETKDNQLEMKDSQINQYSELLKNQQLLALQSNKKVEELETTLNQIENKKQEENNTQEGHSETEYKQQNTIDINDSKKEKGFFSKLFGSK